MESVTPRPDLYVLFFYIYPMHDEFQFEAFFNLTQCNTQSIICYDLKFPIHHLSEEIKQCDVRDCNQWHVPL